MSDKFQAESGSEENVIEGYSFLVSLDKSLFGEVYRCKKDGREYAVKRVEESQVNTFIEAISAGLNSKFLVKYISKIQGPSNKLFVVMEPFPQENLRMTIETLKDLKAWFRQDLIMKILIQLLLGLEAIHRKKLLHRNLKPENVHVDRENNVKIELETTGPNAQTTIGTPEYESPQIVEGKPFDSTDDLWALGVLLYELCTLNRPFVETDIHKLRKRILSGTYNPIPKGRCPDQVIGITDSLLSVNPQQRQSALSLLRHPFIREYAEAFKLLQYFPL